MCLSCDQFYYIFWSLLVFSYPAFSDYASLTSQYKKHERKGERSWYFSNLSGWLIALLWENMHDRVLLPESKIIGSFVWQTCRPNTNLVTRICAWAIKAKMYSVDALIRPIAFVHLDPEHKCELLDSCLVYMITEQIGQRWSPLISVLWKYPRWWIGLFVD